jgi:hypothetical protein
MIVRGSTDDVADLVVVSDESIEVLKEDSLPPGFLDLLADPPMSR